MTFKDQVDFLECIKEMADVSPDIETLRKQLEILLASLKMLEKK